MNYKVIVESVHAFNLSVANEWVLSNLEGTPIARFATYNDLCTLLNTLLGVRHWETVTQPLGATATNPKSFILGVNKLGDKL